MSIKDVAYFVGVTHRVVLYRYQQLRQRGVDVFPSNVPSARGVTYCRIAQVHEAFEAGFRCHDLKELLGFPGAVVKDIMTHRQEYEQNLVVYLRKLYNDSRIRKPLKRDV